MRDHARATTWLVDVMAALLSGRQALNIMRMMGITLLTGQVPMDAVLLSDVPDRCAPAFLVSQPVPAPIIERS